MEEKETWKKERRENEKGVKVRRKRSGYQEEVE